MATEKRLIYATFAQHIANVELHDDEAGIVQWVLSHTPTVDAVEVVHGRWVIEKRHTVSTNPYMDDNYHAHATCSECNFCIHSENASFGYPKLNTTNYCPNCGAKMDGDPNG